jgi:hypothetical protein
MNIYASIIGVMGDISPIAKGRKNVQQGFMYRGVDEVMNELQPILVKHKVFIVPEVLETTRAEKITSKGGTLFYSIQKVKFTFYADDGSSISAVIIGEGMDAADKASNKALAVAFKYACFQVFCIPTEDAKDPDAESHPNITPSDVVDSDFVQIKSALIDYINAGLFEHPENVNKVIADGNVEQMKRALEAAKKKEAAK